jgi:hypothetical protein
MVRSMAPTAVEQDKTSSPEERFDLPEADRRWRPAHLFDQLIDLAHAPTLSFWLIATSHASAAYGFRLRSDSADSSDLAIGPFRWGAVYPRAQPTTQS